MSKPSSTHPAVRPIAMAMREVEIVRQVEWCSDRSYRSYRTYRVRFDRRVSEEDIERFLETLKTEYRYISTDEQVTGHTVVVERATDPSVLKELAGESDE